MDMKSCGQCRTLKPFSAFHTRGGSTAPRAVCIECVKNSRQKACVSCGLEFVPNGRHASRCPGCYPSYRQAVNLHAAAKHRAAKGGLAFDLDVEGIRLRLQDKCPRTGLHFDILSPSSDMSDRSPLGPSIDKIDPSKGYTWDNVQIVTWWYNVSKQRFTDKDVLQLCEAVVNQARS